jgi:hypothetical protein
MVYTLNADFVYSAVIMSPIESIFGSGRPLVGAVYRAKYSE